MASQKRLAWSMHTAYIQAMRSFDDHINDTYVWIEEALTEIKKTFETADIQLIPKTPSAKRTSKRRLDRNTRACGRSMRSTNSSRNRESQDSGVDFDLPRRTRNRKQSKLDYDESIGHLDSIRESLPLDEVDDKLELSESKELTSTKSNDGQQATRQKKTKQDEQQKVDEVVERVSADQLNEKTVSFLSKDNVVAEEEAQKLVQLKLQKSCEVELNTNCIGNTQNNDLNALPNGKVQIDQANSDTSKQFFNSKTLSEEFKLKDCSVMLGQNPASESPGLVSNTNQPAALRQNIFPSPHSSSFALPSSSNSDSASAGGRFMNMVKCAVGALHSAVIRRTGSPSAAPGSGSPILVNQSPCKAAAINNAIADKSVQLKRQSKEVEPVAKISERLSQTRRSSSLRKASHIGPRLSISKRRSASFGNKARLAKARKSRSLSIRQSSTRLPVDNEEKPLHVISNALDDEDMPTDDEASDSDSEIMDTPPQRVTRSKLRKCPPTVVVVPGARAPVGPVAGAMRVTRSKMRTKDKQPSLDDDDDSTPTSVKPGFLVPITPSTIVKSKPLGTKVQQMQKLLSQNPSFGLSNSVQKSVPVLSSLNKVRRKSTKRAIDCNQSKCRSSPKRVCTGTKQSFFSPDETGRRIQTAKNAETHSFLKKKQTTPVHSSVSSVITSFLQKTTNTPKILTHEEILERKRRDLEEKNKKMSEMAQKRAELMNRRVEEQRRMREEQHQQVMKRRQEMEKEVKKAITSASTTRLSEDALPRAALLRLQADDRDKQKLREKRAAEAEQRRKQEEESKKQMLLQQERDKQAHEEQVRRRREQEEAERQQRLAEQRQQEEDRRARLALERQLAADRQKLLEEQRLREDQEKQRAKEERERKERLEKERQEMERIRERERQKQLEIERQKELERQRLADAKLKQEEERRLREEQQKTQKAIEKHNLLQKNSQNATAGPVRKEPPTGPTSAATQQTATALKPHVDNVLNRTFNKETNDSYAMTPVAKKVYKSASAENYDINDLNSEDSTDEEDKPRKKIPKWAEGTALRVALINQHCHPPDLEKLFGFIAPPDLNELFVKKKARFNKRTSSAIWDASIHIQNTP